MRTLIIGSGFIGRAVGAGIAARGGGAVLASRNRVPLPESGPGGLTWTALDATDPGDCARVVEASGADTVLLVHGPSDVTWCEANPAEALATHEVAAVNAARAAAGRRTVLISTDNVFDGTAAVNDESAAVRPANAYGTAKLRAEEALLSHASDATVLRVSLVYGWEPAESAKWLNFFSACAHALAAGREFRVPEDQWTTPVLVDDVAEVTRAVLRGPAPELLHLGGPDRISRADWARLIAEETGGDPRLVRAVRRAASRYASRPENTCLTSTLLPHLAATAAVRPRGVREAARGLIRLAGQAAANPDR